VKKHGFIYVLLIAALCFSQLAATVHVAGHLGPHRSDIHHDAGHWHGSLHQRYNSNPNQTTPVHFSPTFAPHTAHNEWLPAFAIAHYAADAGHRATIGHLTKHNALDGAHTDSNHGTHVSAHHAVHHESQHDAENPRDAATRHGLFGTDCAAYHTYIGLSFCLFGISTDFAIAATCPSFTPLQSNPVSRKACPGLPIRAPPTPV
jgi:hypothetical protein